MKMAASIPLVFALPVVNAFVRVPTASGVRPLAIREISQGRHVYFPEMSGSMSSAAFSAELSLPRRHAPCIMTTLPGPRSLREDMDKAIAARGLREASFLPRGEALKAVKQRGGSASTASGFGASSKPSKAAKSKQSKRPPSALAKEMQRAGVVRIDGVLSAESVDKLRQFVDEERAIAEAEVAEGLHSQEARFADLVLVENRCDFLMPLRGATIDAMDEMLSGSAVLGSLIEELIGEDAVMQEVACLISEPGSNQQPLHPDTPYTPTPTLYAGFVALQDVELEMGPTIYLPGTHTRQAHLEFYGGDLEAARMTSGERTAPVAAEFLSKQRVSLGLLRKGDMALYNQQVLHCGGANQSDSVRRQFYLSWRNPAVKVKARASIRPAYRNQLTLGIIRDELTKRKSAAAKSDPGDGPIDLFAKLDAVDRAVV